MAITATATADHANPSCCYPVVGDTLDGFCFSADTQTYVLGTRCTGYECRVSTYLVCPEANAGVLQPDLTTAL